MNERSEQITDKITIHYSWEFDPEPDTSWLGKFIKHETEDTYKRESVGHNELEYILPTYSFAQRKADYESALRAEKHATPITTACVKAMAELKSDMDILEAINNGNSWFEVCTAELLIDGAIVGASVGGIHEPDETYRRVIEDEQRSEVLASAQDTLMRETQNSAQQLVIWREYQRNLSA